MQRIVSGELLVAVLAGHAQGDVAAIEAGHVQRYRFAANGKARRLP